MTGADEVTCKVYKDWWCVMVMVVLLGESTVMGLCLGCESDHSRSHSVTPEDDTCITIVPPSR